MAARCLALCAPLLACGAASSASYPAAPWVQRGTAYVQTMEVDVKAARAVVPMEFGIVETKKGSGKTSGSLYVVQYTNASTVAYSEFIFLPATVTYRGEQAGWVGAIWVDSTAAQGAGREVWGLQKRIGVFEWDRATDPKLQHVKLTDAETGALVLDASFDDDVLITIPGQKQTEASFGVGATAGAAAGLPPNTVVLSKTEQHYGVKLLKTVYLNVPDSSPLHPVFASATLKTKVAMANGVFNMTAPTVLGRPSRAKKLWVTTPEVTSTGAAALPVTSGAIPEWLQGSLIRNSASGYENGADEIRHWNDGWAQLHRWEISGNKPVAHHSRWLNTSSYFKASSEGKITQAGYGTPANPGPRPHVPLKTSARGGVAASGSQQRLGGIKDKFAINPMVNVWKFDNKFMATTDQNMFVEFDPDTLETKGDVNEAWSDDAITKKGLMGIGVAHGRFDRFTREHYWLEIDLAMAVTKAKYNVWTYQEVNFTGTGPLPARKLLATLEDADTSFIHSFGLTQNYILLIQCPMHYHFLKFPTAKQVIDTTTWDADTPVKFHVLRRDTGALVKTVESDEGAFFVYHVLNAFEQEGADGEPEIAVDFSRYSNDTLITQGMFLENLVDMPELYTPTYAQAKLTRCTLGLGNSSGTAAPRCARVVDRTFEMASFNWEHYHMRRPRFAWGASFHDANTPWNRAGSSDFIDEILKIDIEQGAVAGTYHEDGVFICEPIFAPRPGGTAEDDGVLLTVGHDSAADRSFLAIINATTMDEVARVNMAGHLAGNFHGKWCPAGLDHCIGL